MPDASESNHIRGVSPYPVPRGAMAKFIAWLDEYSTRGTPTRDEIIAKYDELMAEEKPER